MKADSRLEFILCSATVILMLANGSLMAQKQKDKAYSFNIHLLSGEHRNGIFVARHEYTLILKQKRSDSLISML